MVEVKLNVSDEAYREAQRVANLRRKDVAEVMRDYLEQEFVGEDSAADESREREKAAFLRLHPKLLQQFAGEYVAIHGGEVVDHGEDRLALSQRINGRYPDTFVLIRPVHSEAEIEYRFRSPRFDSAK